MEKIILEVNNREILGKQVKSLRAEGFIPAVVYGHKFSSQHLTVPYKDFEKIFKEIGGTKVIELKKPEAKGNLSVIIHDVSFDVVTRKPIHVDFYRVKMDEKITARIPLHFIGESKAVKELDGSLITNRSDIEVECLPGDLIQEIEVDISVIEDFETSIHVSDLKVPESVKILDEMEETVATVEEPRSEEELEELEEVVEENVPEEAAVEGEAEAGEAEGETKEAETEEK